MPHDPLSVRCPRCHAAPGERCKDYRGKGAAPHRDRKKLADPQAGHRRQAELKTKREREKAARLAAEDAGPLFAAEAVAEALAGVRTPEENYWRTRYMVAGIMEDSEPRAGFHDDFLVGFLRRLAMREMSAETFAFLDAKDWKGDELTFWKDVLTGSRTIDVRRERRSLGHFPFRWTDADGNEREQMMERVQVVVLETWPPEGWRPPFTRGEINEMLAVKPPPEQDDGGLSRHVDAALARLKGGAL